MRNITEATLTAYLRVKGWKETLPPKLIKNSITFFFEDTPQINKEIEAFWRGETTIEPMAQAEALRLIKAQIVDLRRNQKGGDSNE